MKDEKPSSSSVSSRRSFLRMLSGSVLFTDFQPSLSTKNKVRALAIGSSNYPEDSSRQESESNSTPGWSMFQANPANTGYLSETTGPDGNNEKWRFPSVASYNYRTSSPEVADETVYIGTQRGAAALSASDGSFQWQFDVGETVNTPTFANNTLYLVTRDNNVFAVDVKSKTEQWRFELGGLEPGEADPVPSPVVADGNVVDSSSPLVFVSDRENYVYALSATDGSEQWRFESDYVLYPPTVRRGTVYIGSGNGNVYTVSASDGSEQWRYETEDGFASTPAVVDGTIYAAIGGDLSAVVALSAADGSEQWRFETEDDGFYPPLEMDGTIFVSSTDIVYALDSGDGSEQWSYQMDRGESPSIAVGNGAVYVGSRYGFVYALSGSDGSEMWRYQTGNRVTSSPAVIDGTVFVGNRNEAVFALDTEDGSEQWHHQTGREIESSPAVVNETVYIGSADGNVYALSTEDGSEQWRYQTGDVVDSSPAVADGTVYVGSWDGNIYALSTADGSEQWRSEGTAGILLSKISVVDGTVYVGNSRSPGRSLYALSAVDGSEQWRNETAFATPPAVVGGSVYIGGADGNVYALSTSDGSEQWRYQTGDGLGFAPTVKDGSVYIGSEDQDNGVVYALSAADGSEQWRYQTDGEVSSSPAVVDGTVYVGSRDNNLYALSAADGSEIWRYETDGPIFSSPAVVDGTVYAGSIDNNLYALSTTDGSEQWRFETGHWVSSSPAVVNGTVYVGSRDGLVYAIGGDDVEDGSVVEEGFNPELHGFGFSNWPPGGFTPPHNHETIAEDAFQTQFEQEWIPQMRQVTSFPLPPSVISNVGGALYDTLRQGPAELHSDGHCYGMCLAAQQYFEEGLPESLPNNTDSASDISKPTGEYDTVGGEIDELHRSQALDSDTLKQGQFLSPYSSQAEEPIPVEEEVRAIHSTIEQNGTALVGIGSSPSDQSVSGTHRHQVLGYNIEFEQGESVDDADVAVIDIYDPNDTAQQHGEEPRQLEIDISEPSVQPIMNNDGEGYDHVYQRFVLIGPSRLDNAGAIKFTSAMARDLLINYLEGFITILANSPVRIDAVAPDGTQLSHPDNPVDGTPPSEIVYLTGAPAGKYEIRVEGTDNGEYTIEVNGSTTGGGSVTDNIAGTISEGEVQTLTANIPNNPGEVGNVTSEDNSNGTDASGPGMDVLAGVVGLVSGGYLISRQNDDGEKE